MSGHVHEPPSKNRISTETTERPAFRCCQFYWEYLQPTVSTGLILFFREPPKYFDCIHDTDSWCISLIVRDHAWVMMWEQSLSDVEYWVSAYSIKTAYRCKVVWHFKEELLSGWAASENLTFFAFWRSSFKGSTASPCKSNACL